MRLIDTSTYELHEFNKPGHTPYYAILSHTWGDDEYLFSDQHDPNRRASAGFKKISGCCALAARKGYKYLWVDTCCIDKTSSAELTESINSMYRWYEQSHVCYVYLADFSLQKALDGRGMAFCYSRWFRRGWTLQELLAPRDVFFYDADWIEVGSKTFLIDRIKDICRIDPRHLSQPKQASVAAKMSWASMRTTTREEDIAYSLLGLFEVNMPLIYGEGENAFFRLQCEIINSCSDESIFAWKDKYPLYSGLLADGPWCFKDSGDIVPVHVKNLNRPPYTMTNRGLSIKLTNNGVDRLETFVAQLSRNGDSRLKQCDKIDGGCFKTVLACARRSREEAPAILTIGTIDGVSASRVRCTDLEFDKIHAAKDKATEVGLQRLYLVGQQRDNFSCEVQLGRRRCVIHLKLTSAAREVFVMSRIVADGFDIVDDGVTALCSFDSSTLDIVAWLRFQRYHAISFIIWWDVSGQVVNICEGHGLDFHKYSPRFIVEYILPEHRRKMVSGDNLILPIDNKLFLWISMQQVPMGLREYVVLIDVTSIDRSKVLH
ncbi:MAG: hypothetical protein Q9218_002345 [Villophora microphyllina]